MNTMKTLTVVQAKHLADEAERLFDKAAAAWVRGNNSGNTATMDRCNTQCDKLRRDAEKLLTPLGIVVDYPGLYPSFTVDGYGHHSTLSAVSAAMERSAAK